MAGQIQTSKEKPGKRRGEERRGEIGNVNQRKPCPGAVSTVAEIHIIPGLSSLGRGVPAALPFGLALSEGEEDGK